jgi:PITH domain
MDLNTFIMKQQCECMNESDDHPFTHCLTSAGGYLESDCDEQVRTVVKIWPGVLSPHPALKIRHWSVDSNIIFLQLIINISFNQAVKVHSIKIKAPQDKGPKNIKIFINQPRTLDFDTAESNSAVQEIE